MDDRQLKEKVRKLLLSNVQKGHSGLLGREYYYIVPSPKTYPFQFWWDTCFQAIILCELGEYDAAKKSMKSLFNMQEASGFVGHMIFWNKILPTNKRDILQSHPTLKAVRPHMSALIQPPLVAKTVERIYKKTQDKYFLFTMIPKLKMYFDWLEECRDFEKEGLITLISPFESGIDWKPSYDKAVNFNDRKANWKLYWKVMLGVDGRNFINHYNLPKIYKNGYFLVKDTLFNVLYSQDLKALARLLEREGIKEHRIYQKRGIKAANKILEIMYDNNTHAFYDVYGRNNKKLTTLTFTTFAPLMMEETPLDITHSLVEKHLLNKDEFLTKYPIPSVAIDEPSFSTNETKFLWRGPTWVVANWFIFQCLMSKNYIKEANMLADSVKNLIKKGGFREYYNPFTGEGMGAKNFTWSGLVVDMQSDTFTKE